MKKNSSQMTRMIELKQKLSFMTLNYVNKPPRK